MTKYEGGLIDGAGRGQYFRKWQHAVIDYFIQREPVSARDQELHCRFMLYDRCDHETKSWVWTEFFLAKTMPSSTVSLSISMKHSRFSNLMMNCVKSDWTKYATKRDWRATFYSAMVYFGVALILMALSFMNRWESRCECALKVLVYCQRKTWINEHIIWDLRDLSGLIARSAGFLSEFLLALSLNRFPKVSALYGNQKHFFWVESSAIS